MTIPTHLIENALKLTGTPMSKMENTHNEYQFFFEPRFFFAYLLSPEFIEKYAFIVYEWNDDAYKYTSSRCIGQAIYEYQRKDKEFPDGNSGPLISLLEKIQGQP